MRILIATIGTRGDVQPFVALAVGLQAAGHEVVICTCPRFREFVSRHGIAFCHLEDGLLELLESDFGRGMFEDLNGVWGILRALPKVLKRVGPIHRRMVDDCWAATESSNPDLIIYHPKMFCVPAFAAVRSIPAVLGMLCPLHVPTGEKPLFGPSMGRVYNRCTYRFVHQLAKFGTQSYLRDWRTRHDQRGLSKHSGPTQTLPGKPIPVLHAHSNCVWPRPHDWPDHAWVTGYWFLSQDEVSSDSWRPDRELETFLESGPTPIYVGFGSMASVDPSRVTRILRSAVAMANVRAIVATGWGGIDTVENTHNLHVLNSAPHAWLFPRVSAVVHHGGAGTTAAGLRAGCPTVISPFGLDQPLWGRRVVELGVGVATVAQKQLTDTILAEAIRQVTTDASYRTAAASIAETLRREDGVSNAVEAIEKIAISYASSAEKEC